MKASLEALSIELDSRNVALGNNPCTPYDVCVKYFGGLDADIVHWEQSYFCDGGKVSSGMIIEHSKDNEMIIEHSIGNEMIIEPSIGNDMVKGSDDCIHTTPRPQSLIA